MTYLFIAHDLAMVRYVSDQIGVMRRGHLLELGSSSEIYHYGVHPYTESLLSAIPYPDPRHERARRRLVYTPPGDADVVQRAMRPIGDSHFIYCTEEEQIAYAEKLSRKKAGE